LRKIQTTEGELSEIMTILAGQSFSVTAFGSRARGTARPDSDLDLCLKNGETAVPLREMARLRAAFEQSRLPFVVDLVDFSQLPVNFQTQINREGIQLV
jgi:predicted nucleotidyltransferase